MADGAIGFSSSSGFAPLEVSAVGTLSRFSAADAPGNSDNCRYAGSMSCHRGRFALTGAEYGRVPWNHENVRNRRDDVGLAETGVIYNASDAGGVSPNRVSWLASIV